MTTIFALFMMALTIYLLAIITDEFFIESLDEIAGRWGLPSNVAGASLMAMGSSMPELSIALIALVSDGGSHSDFGIGNIVGSAVFNVLIITGASALVRPAKVTWQVVVRDCLMYTFSIGLLLYAFWDGQIVLFEGALFLALYAAYIYILYQWEMIAPEADNIVEVLEEEIAADTEKTGLFYRITGFVSRFIHLLTGDPRRNYGRTFLISVALIAAISYVLVEYAILFAEGIGVPPILVALTIVAGGSSVPDLIASLLVSRQGRGEMAVSNAVGSNIFDITIGLGVPWVLVLLFSGGAIDVGTGDLMSSTFVLLGTVVVLFLFLSTGQRLSRWEGGILVVLYVIYVIWTWTGSA
jgi:K+-dependent Na+/Ca+ exchanger-like protein